MLGTQTQSQWAQKSAAVDALFDSWTTGNRPGAAVAIIHDGNPVHEKGYGVANLAVGSPIDSKTSFRLASLTKQFTSMAIMILSEAKKLRYEDPICQYLPEFSSFSRRGTIRHLLNHTSGVDDYEELFLETGIINGDYPTSSSEAHKGPEPTFQDALDLLAPEMLRFLPGEQWEYSNSGYVLLASIVERISGQTLSRFLKENIFEPLDMDDSVLSEQVQPEPKLANQASGYVLNEGVLRETDYTPLNAIYGPDGVYSTMDDMVKWCQSLHGEKLVKTATKREAFRSGKLSSGANVGYGFGWFTARCHEMLRVSHTGSWMGFRSFLDYYPEHRFAVLALANSAEFDDYARSVIAGRLARIYLGEMFASVPAVTVKPEVLRKYTGKYELESGEIFEITLEGSTLMVNSALFPVRLIPESKVKFFVEDAESDSYFFHRDEQGHVRSLTRYLSLFGYTHDASCIARRLES